MTNPLGLLLSCAFLAVCAGAMAAVVVFVAEMADLQHAEREGPIMTDRRP